jgi:hypothetical protein
LVYWQSCRKLRGKLVALSTPLAGSGGRGADSHMVGMSIAPIRPKGNHHIRAEAADDFDHPSGQHLCINAAERAIHILQTQSMLNAQALTGQV